MKYKSDNLYTAKRNKILEASVKVFVRKGYYRTQMEDVAREAGVAKGTLYLYFKSKEELFSAFFESIFEQGLFNLTKIKKMPVNAIEKLRKFAKNQLEFCEKSMDLFMMISRESHQLDKTLKAEYKQKLMKKYKEIINSLSEIVKQGIKEKLIKPIDIVLSSLIFTGIIESAVFKNVEFGKRVKLTKQLPMIMNIFLSGVGRRNK